MRFGTYVIENRRYGILRSVGLFLEVPWWLTTCMCRLLRTKVLI